MRRAERVEAVKNCHGLGKWIAKTLALRVAPFMNNLISQAQSAFIKTRSIHDNFLYVRNLIRRLHRSKTPLAKEVEDVIPTYRIEGLCNV